MAQRHGDLAQLPELRQHRRDEHLIRRARPQLLDEGASRAEHVRGGVEAVSIARRMVADVSAADLRPSSQTLGSEAPNKAERHGDAGGVALSVSVVSKGATDSVRQHRLHP